MNHPSPPRVFLDCSHTAKTLSANGIQRVVRNIVRQATRLAPAYGVDCRAVARDRAYYQEVTPLLQRSRLDALWPWISRMYFSLATPLLQPLPIPLLHRWFLPRPGRRGVFNLPYRLGQLSLRAIQSPLTAVGLYRPPVVSLQSGDLLMIMEPGTYQGAWDVIDTARANGVRIGALVYDLIPYTHPQFCSASYARMFDEWFQAAARRVDFFLAISDTVRGHVAQHLAEALPRECARPDVHAFHLGADLDVVQRGGSIRGSVRQVFDRTDTPLYLYVGTIEPRKNHHYLLDAFEIAWRRGSQARLAIVGRIGWLCDDVVRRLGAHPELGQRLWWFNNLTDTELDYCYRHADGMVYPSIVEGFGLPLIEALGHRLRVLASDIPIHREVGKDYCAYFSLQNPQSLADMMNALDQAPESLGVRDPQTFQATSWRQSGLEFLQVCRRHVERPAGLQPAHSMPVRRAA